MKAGSPGRVGAAAARDYVYRRLEELSGTILGGPGPRRDAARAERDFLREQQRLIPAVGNGPIVLDPALYKAVREASQGPRGNPKARTKPRKKAASAHAPAMAPAKASAGAKTRRGGRGAVGEEEVPAVRLWDRVMVVDGSHWATGKPGGW